MLHSRTRPEEYLFLRKAIGYMHNYPGLIHHPAEELIFTCLRQSVPDCAALCMQLTEQHNEFNILETTLFGYIDHAQRGEMACRELLKKLTNTYCMDQFEHITLEEDEILPKAVACLTPDDWRNIGCQSNLQLDPLGDPDILKHYDSLYDYITAIDINLQSH